MGVKYIKVSENLSKGGTIMKKEKIKQQQKSQNKFRSEGTNMIIGIGLGIIFYLIFGNYILSAIAAIIAVTILGIGSKND
ncbi:MAG: hypothetical protein APG08_00704 [Candidatus Methanofastidiosum methylothiophilum]|uniref:Uncharacterized protein n=1 Tax=Candidatus Methanofastidiosum methylothiophilum TaxID=1705564 RepID=A0A150JKQ4_9EURY|nr:MAG: hypothetical protein AN188_01199 [Candidatus Methanofastidiosum methylthiophilus]MBP6932150.1 hypothetical protein [Methanofastidiosum sp.]OQC52349.1 MAG: hypothetical protein BWX56_00379 [Euryarchaeota archaeon ADurb.Bin023]KYC56747.1 MAG: hypothetical protein APG08_00704 [Candidatus Methanofastidiosum methylthiophilus]KYC57839.1 MAG: hypothetical protein APG09_00866 [Candidatus Methanofastidiosum methylthiophilus]